MIEIVKGDLFKSGCEALVNTVNCKGVMGKGLALAFKNKYPKMFRAYKHACDNGLMKIGCISQYKDSSGITIINFPTKDHFRQPSRLEYIEAGLEEFVKCYQRGIYDFKSIAFPMLGCGLGGLNSDTVLQIMIDYLEPLVDLEVKIYRN